MRPISPVVFAFAASSLLLATVVAAHDDDVTLTRLARGPSTTDEWIAHTLERRAIAQLDRGLARWPGAWPLVSRALDLERAAGRYDAALARLDALSATSPARPELLAMRGDVLAAAGRRLEAGEAWSIALEVLQSQ